MITLNSMVWYPVSPVLWRMLTSSTQSIDYRLACHAGNLSLIPCRRAQVSILWRLVKGPPWRGKERSLSSQCLYALAGKQQHANMLFEPPTKFVTEQLGMTYGRGTGQCRPSNYLAVKETQWFVFFSSICIDLLPGCRCPSWAWS